MAPSPSATPSRGHPSVGGQPTHTPPGTSRTQCTGQSVPRPSHTAGGVVVGLVAVSGGRSPTSTGLRVPTSPLDPATARGGNGGADTGPRTNHQHSPQPVTPRDAAGRLRERIPHSAHRTPPGGGDWGGWRVIPDDPVVGARGQTQPRSGEGVNDACQAGVANTGRCQSSPASGTLRAPRSTHGVCAWGGG